jgi:hypothetical protein
LYRQFFKSLKIEEASSDLMGLFGFLERSGGF